MKWKYSLAPIIAIAGSIAVLAILASIVLHPIVQAPHPSDILESEEVALYIENPRPELLQKMQHAFPSLQEITLTKKVEALAVMQNQKDWIMFQNSLNSDFAPRIATGSIQIDTTTRATNPLRTHDAFAALQKKDQPWIFFDSTHLPIEDRIVPIEKLTSPYMSLFVQTGGTVFSFLEENVEHNEFPAILPALVDTPIAVLAAANHKILKELTQTYIGKTQQIILLGLLAAKIEEAFGNYADMHMFDTLLEKPFALYVAEGRIDSMPRALLVGSIEHTKADELPNILAGLRNRFQKNHPSVGTLTQNFDGRFSTTMLMHKDPREAQEKRNQWEIHHIETQKGSFATAYAGQVFLITTDISLLLSALERTQELTLPSYSKKFISAGGSIDTERFPTILSQNLPHFLKSGTSRWSMQRAGKVTSIILD